MRSQISSFWGPLLGFMYNSLIFEDMENSTFAAGHVCLLKHVLQGAVLKWQCFQSASHRPGADSKLSITCCLGVIAPHTACVLLRFVLEWLTAAFVLFFFFCLCSLVWTAPCWVFPHWEMFSWVLKNREPLLVPIHGLLYTKDNMRFRSLHSRPGWMGPWAAWSGGGVPAL